MANEKVIETKKIRNIRYNSKKLSEMYFFFSRLIKFCTRKNWTVEPLRVAQGFGGKKKIGAYTTETQYGRGRKWLSGKSISSQVTWARINRSQGMFTSNTIQKGRARAQNVSDWG